MIEPTEIESLIKASLADAEVSVKDLTGTKDHFEARIVSAAFAGRTLIDRHRLVYAALGDAMKQRIHALTMKTLTPEETR